MVDWEAHRNRVADLGLLDVSEGMAELAQTDSGYPLAVFIDALDRATLDPDSYRAIIDALPTALADVGGWRGQG